MAWKPRRNPLRYACTAALALLALSGCISSNGTINTKQDYEPSVTRFSESDYSGALESLPKKEGDTFIPTLERAYLDWLRGTPKLEDLTRYRDLVNDRFRYVVSREVQSLFYAELPEGYYASEHEIVWMHLLLGWIYSDLGDQEAACVEARMAGYLLDAPWSEEGRFDDPTLRVILGGLFARCGEWQEAAVDFRAAHALDPSLDWAGALGEREHAPEELFIVFGGIGPEPRWNPSLEWNPLRGARDITFKFHGWHSEAKLDTPERTVPLHLTAPTTLWYARHVERDNAIQELIVDSKYGLNTTYESGRHAAMIGYGTTVFVAYSAIGVGVGYLILRICLEASCGEGIAGVVLAPIWGVTQGAKRYNEITDESRERFDYESNPANFYRFVRFLPEYVWVGWIDRRLKSDTVDIRRPSARGSTRIALGPPPKGQATRVTVAHIPDVTVSSRAAGNHPFQPVDPTYSR